MYEISNFNMFYQFLILRYRGYMAVKQKIISFYLCFGDLALLETPANNSLLHDSLCIKAE